MASNLKYSAVLKNAQMAALPATAGASAPLDVMGGAQPASPDVAVFNTTLNGAITNVATSLVVTSATGLPASGNYTLWVDAEQMTVTAGQGSTTLTVTRAANGSAAVAHASGAPTTATPVLATLTCNATFAPAAVAGLLTLNAITASNGNTVAGLGSAASWYRVRNGVTPHIDGSAGTGAFDLNLTNASIASGQPVSVNSSTYTSNN